MRFRYLFVSISFILFFLLSWVVYNNLRHDEQLSIILLTVESLRNDMITEENCPKLLEAAKGATRLEQYRAVSGWTGSNIVSLLTGLSPFQTGVHTRGQSLTPSFQVPLNLLAEKGYLVEGMQPFMAMDLYQNLGLTISDSGGDPLVWLAENQLTKNPYFFWYHYVDTHLPYRASASGEGQQPDELNHAVKRAESISDRFALIEAESSIYFNEAHYSPEDADVIHSMQGRALSEFDTWFDTFFSFLKSGGFLRNTILIVTADHGDEHGERGMVGHASTTLAGHLHEEIVHIPFFIWVPEGVQSAHTPPKATALTSHLDVIPTLFHLLNVDYPARERLWGRSIFGEEPNKTWVAMTSSGGFAEPDPHNIRYFEYSLIQENWKSRLRIFADGREEIYLYDLLNDPQEQINQADADPERFFAHREFLRPLIEEQEKRSPVVLEHLSESDGTVPVWIRPVHSGRYSYDDLDGSFLLKWEGPPNEKYIIEYRAGRGRKKITGFLDADTNSKDFGTIGRGYWNKWIVPYSPISIRVKGVDHSRWSSWIRLEAVQ